MAEFNIIESPATRRIARKSHTKSRNGCANCKKRRIKCDEQHPRCTNCVRHGSTCSFAPSSSGSPENYSRNGAAINTPSQTPSPPISFRSPNPSNGAPTADSPVQFLNVLDLELMHNYYTSVSLTIADNPEVQTFMRVNVPQLGFSYPFILHGVLAVSALHLSRFKRGDSQAQYLSQAQHHYDTGLRVANDLLANASVETRAPLHIFATLCILCTFAAGPRPGDLLVVGIQGPAKWLDLFRRLRQQQEVSLSEKKADVFPIHGIFGSSRSGKSSNNERLHRLKEEILAISPDDPDLQLYLTTLDDLAKCFPSNPTSPPPISRPISSAAETSPQHVFAWLQNLPDEFALALQQRKPIALIIMSHFCIMLKPLNMLWWARGWPERLMAEIQASLSDEYQTLLKWPVEEVGSLRGLGGG